MRERLEYVDQIRGFAILLVIVGHLIQFNQIGGGDSNPLFNVIYSFHMPLFFMISGYIGSKVSKVSSLQGYGLFLLKKAKVLLIPYFFWRLVINKYFLTAEWSQVVSIDAIGDAIIHPRLLWFLPMLFEIFIFFGAFLLVSSWVMKRANIVRDLILVVSIILMIISGIFLIDKSHFTSLSLFAFSFFTGVMVSRHKMIENLMLSRWVFLLFLVSFLVFACHWKAGGDYGDDIYKVIISVSAFISVMNIFRKIKWNAIFSQQLMLIGRESLVIYVVHFHLVFLGLGNLSKLTLNPLLLFFILTIVAVPIAYFCIGFSKIVRLSPVLSFLLFGK